MKIFPNPVSNRQPVTLTFERPVAGVARVELIQSCGTCVFQTEIPLTAPTRSVELTFDSIPRGLYILAVKIGDKFGQQKVLIQ